jgi:purine-binding chemotaxis protein CheW
MKKNMTAVSHTTDNTVSAEDRKILRTRAQQLANPLQSDTLEEASLELLEFRLAQEYYALETRHVQEVYPLKDLAVMPCTPAFVLGMVNVRGNITPVIDIKKFFDLPDKGLTDLHRIIIVQGNDIEIGLLADVIVGLRTVAADSLQPPLPTFTGIHSDYLKGVTKECLVVLDLDHILADPRIIVNEEVVT